MLKNTDRVSYLACLCTLLWLATTAFAAAPPNASGCPGTVLAGGGLAATLSCGGAQCLQTGTCAMSSGHAIPNPPPPKVTLYHFDGQKWVRTAGAPPQGSTTSVCVCKQPDPNNPGQFVYTFPNALCCHLVEVNFPDGSQRAATKGTCAACPQPGRCHIVGQAQAPAIGEADCVVN